MGLGLLLLISGGLDFVGWGLLVFCRNLLFSDFCGYSVGDFVFFLYRCGR